MKIKMLTLDAGPDGVREPGKTYEVPAADAKALIAGGYAVDATNLKAGAGVTRSAPAQAVARRGRTATETVETPALDENPDENPEE